MKITLLSVSLLLTTVILAQDFPRPGQYISGATFSWDDQTSSWDSTSFIKSEHLNGYRLYDSTYYPSSIDSSWEFSGVTTYGWIDDKIDSSLHRSIDGQGNLIPSTRMRYAYENGITTLSEQHVWEQFSQSWRPTYQLNWELDAQGNPLRALHYQWNSQQQQLVAYDSTLFLYDQNGLNDTVLTYVKQQSNWALGNIETYVYDSIGQVYLAENHDVFMGDTTPISRNEYTYDSLGRTFEQFNYYWNGMTYFLTGKTVNTYEGSSERPTEFGFYEFDGANFVKTSFYSFSYDQGRLSESYYMQVFGGDTTGFFRSEYEYLPLTPPTGINENTVTNVNVFPNPTTDVVHLVSKSNLKIERVELIDLQGRNVHRSGNVSQNAYQIQTSYMPAGNYFYQLRMEDGSTQQGQIVKH